MAIRKNPILAVPARQRRLPSVVTYKILKTTVALLARQHYPHNMTPRKAHILALLAR